LFLYFCLLETGVDGGCQKPYDGTVIGLATRIAGFVFTRELKLHFYTQIMNHVLVILFLSVVPLLAQATEPVFAWVKKASVNRRIA